MSKRAHPEPDPEGVKLSKQDAEQDPEPQQDGAGAVAGREIPPAKMQHPNPQEQNPLRKDQPIKAGIGIQQHDPSTQHQAVIHRDNIVITDSDTDNPETQALKNLTRQVLKEKQLLIDSILDKNRFIDAKKVDNARLQKEKEALNREIDSLTKQMSKVIAHSSESEREERRVIVPDKTFEDSITPAKTQNYGQ